MNSLAHYQKIINYLDKCIEADALSHAYIFYGPDELAKKAAILKFANEILSINSSFNPDLVFISADADEERSINSIRQLKKFLILRPYNEKYKIAVIEAAEKLNVYAQNALLKIFEEAPKSAIIILNAKTIDGIPETIVSRGIKLPFWRQNNAEPVADKKIIEIFEEILNKDVKDKYCAIQKFNDHETIKVFNLWLRYLRTKFSFEPTKKLNNLLKTSQNIYFKLNETNINPKFAYDELVMALSKN